MKDYDCETVELVLPQDVSFAVRMVVSDKNSN